MSLSQLGDPRVLWRLVMAVAFAIAGMAVGAGWMGAQLATTGTVAAEVGARDLPVMTSSIALRGHVVQYISSVSEVVLLRRLGHMPASAALEDELEEADEAREAATDAVNELFADRVQVERLELGRDVTRIPDHLATLFDDGDALLALALQDVDDDAALVEARAAFEVEEGDVLSLLDLLIVQEVDTARRAAAAVSDGVALFLVRYTTMVVGFVVVLVVLLAWGVRMIRQLTASSVAAESAQRAKTAFLSSMSHELRTPLNAILGLASLARDDVAEGQLDDVPRHLEHIHGAGEDLLLMVQKLLAMSEVGAGAVQAQLRPVALDRVVDGAVDTVRRRAGDRGVEVRHHAAVGGCAVLGDPVLLQEVLVHILDNAVRYTVPGTVVDVSCEPTRRGLVRVAVADHGPGFPAAAADRVFRAFERLGREGGNEHGGGVGLAIARAFTEAMGGRIGVDASYRDGARVWIELATG